VTLTSSSFSNGISKHKNPVWITGADALMDSLKIHGVTTIFGYPGGAILPIYDAVHKAEQDGWLKHFMVRHEQGGSHAADGYARSTGEVMGLAKEFGIAYAKSELAAGNGVPSEGVAFLSTNDLDKKNLEEVARELLVLGFKLIATKGTAAYLTDLGIQVEEVLKVHEGRPNIEDLIRSGLVQLIINTPIGSQALHDDAYLRRAALEYNIPTFTTIPGAKAAIKAIKALQCNKINTYSLQEIHSY